VKSEIENNNNFYKMTKKKKLEIKIMSTKSKNIISSIWIEGLNWKPIKLFQKHIEKNYEVQFPNNIILKD